MFSCSGSCFLVMLCSSGLLIIIYTVFNTLLIVRPYHDSEVLKLSNSFTVLSRFNAVVFAPKILL